MSDDEDEDTHYCLRCSSTITGLDAYVAHRKSKCNQQPVDAYGPGPSGLQDEPLSVDRCHAESPERQREDAEHNLLLQSSADKADDYFFSSLCLQSSTKTGEPVPSPAVKHHGVLTRSKIWERNTREDKPAQQPCSDDAEVLDDSDSEESDDGRHPPPTSGGKWLPGFRPSHRSTSVLWKSATPERPPEAEMTGLTVASLPTLRKCSNFKKAE